MSNTAISPQKNVALMASAGTGKTYNLALRAVSILMTGRDSYQELYNYSGDSVVDSLKSTSSGRILCLTFTKKATAEMAERVEEYLTLLATGEIGESDGRYQAIAEVSGITDPIEMQKTAKRAMERIFRDSSLLQIRTIDSFTSNILKLFPFEAGQQPDFDMTNKSTDTELHNLALRSAFKQLPNATKYIEFFLRYISWRDTQANRFTSSLNSHISWILANSVELREELNSAAAITVDDLSAELTEIEGVDSEIKGVLQEIVVFLNSYQGISAYSKRHITDDAYLEDDIEDIIKFTHPLKIVKSKKDTAPDSYLPLYERFIELVKRSFELQERLEIAIFLHMADYVQRAIDRLKGERNLLSFADLTRIVYNLFHNGEGSVSSDYLYFRLDGRMEHILIDEFQDTSATQWDIIRPMAEEAMAGLTEKIGSFFCVGDTKQTIYRFRGSSLGFFHEVIDQYADRLTLEKLLINHRSDVQIVEFTNKLFQNANDTIAHEEIIFDYTLQQAKSTAEGYVSILPIEGKNKDEYDIQRILQLERAIDELTQSGFAPNDIAILVTKRNNGKLAQKYLESKGIPSYLGFGASLNESPIFYIVRALVQYIYSGDKLSLATFLLTPPAVISSRKIGSPKAFDRYKFILERLLEKTEGQPIYERIQRIGRRLSLAGRFHNEPHYIALLDIIAANIPTVTNPLTFIERMEELSINAPLSSNTERGGVSILTV
ncbi:MAG: UvrD-helicase domain-containing protein, partial [Deferribacteraceae bacterium]|nr:UvrD-helicase domain-containing protein [Deferribacteraceae bacterium]